MNENTITLGENGGSSFSGPKAVDAFRIATLKSAIGLLHATNGRVQPTRGLTMTKALKMATEYTGKKYKRTEADKARADLDQVLTVRKSECTIKHEKE